MIHLLLVPAKNGNKVFLICSLDLKKGIHKKIVAAFLLSIGNCVKKAESISHKCKNMLTDIRHTFLSTLNL